MSSAMATRHQGSCSLRTKCLHFIAKLSGAQGGQYSQGGSQVKVSLQTGGAGQGQRPLELSMHVLRTLGPRAGIFHGGQGKAESTCLRRGGARRGQGWTLQEQSRDSYMSSQRNQRCHNQLLGGSGYTSSSWIRGCTLESFHTSLFWLFHCNNCKTVVTEIGRI